VDTKTASCLKKLRALLASIGSLCRPCNKTFFAIKCATFQSPTRSLRLQRLALTCRMRALTRQLRHRLRVRAGLTAIFLPTGRHTVACWMRAFFVFTHWLSSAGSRRTHPAIQLSGPARSPTFALLQRPMLCSIAHFHPISKAFPYPASPPPR
jgi:hypothetical protein